MFEILMGRKDVELVDKNDNEWSQAEGDFELRAVAPGAEGRRRVGLEDEGSGLKSHE